MSDWYDQVRVPAGFGARERAYYEAVQKYGLSIELNQAGWDPTTDEVIFDVEGVE